ncbi:MAG: C-GCAxxG-C-C family protein [Bacteroidales bacterium]
MKRRKFLAGTLIAALGGLLASCRGTDRTTPEPSPTPAAGSGPEAGFSAALADMRQMPRDLVRQLLDQKAKEYMERSHHCAQSSFLALRDQFGLSSGPLAKAITTLPGVAERGETCGAVTGPLLILGLIYGRDENHLDDWESYQKSLVPAGAFCTAFEKEFGTTLCHRIQEGAFGRCYHLTEAEELAQFQRDGATEGCTRVVQRAVNLAADVILADPDL